MTDPDPTDLTLPPTEPIDLSGFVDRLVAASRTTVIAENPSD
jgi:hypothetical protein